MSKSKKIKRSDPKIPQFKAFTWHLNGPSPGSALQTYASDVGDGIATILEIIELDFIAKENGDKPFFNNAYSGFLLRMAMASAKLLAESAASEIEIANTLARKRTGQE
jgi:hypothetical protein